MSLNTKMLETGFLQLCHSTLGGKPVYPRCISSGLKGPKTVSEMAVLEQSLG